MENQSHLDNSFNKSLSMENYLLHEFDNGKRSLCILVIVSTLLGNSAIVFSYCQNYKMRTATNTMVLNHCVADILLAMSDIAFYITPDYHPRLMESDVFCTFSVFFDCLFKVASILSMCGIALDRYVNLVRNSRKRMTKQRTIVAIACCWLQSTIVASPWNKLAGPEENASKRIRCRALPRFFEAGLPIHGLSVFFKAVAVLLPLLGVCYVSYHVFSTARQRRRVVIQEGPIRVTRRVSTAGFAARGQTRSPITAIILFTVYITCTAPFAVAITWSMFSRNAILAPGVAFAVYFLFRLKGSLFPILYVLRNRFVLSYLHKLVRCDFLWKTSTPACSNAFVTPSSGELAHWSWLSPREARTNGFNFYRRGGRKESRVYYGARTVTVTFDFTDLKRARRNSYQIDHASPASI